MQNLLKRLNADPRIDEIENGEDIMVWLVDGYAINASTHDAQHVFGVDTLSEIKTMLRERVEKCECSQCIHRILADKFVRAGNADYSVTEDDLAQLGLKKQKSFKTRYGGYKVTIRDWEDFCRFVFEKITDKADYPEQPYCNMHGRGFRSRWHGKMVSEAILAKWEKENSNGKA